MKKQFIFAVAAISAMGALSISAGTVTMSNKSDDTITAIFNHRLCRAKKVLQTELLDIFHKILKQKLADEQAKEAMITPEYIGKVTKVLYGALVTGKNEKGSACAIKKIQPGKSYKLSVTGAKGFSVTILDGEKENILIPKKRDLGAGTTATWFGTYLTYTGKDGKPQIVPAEGLTLEEVTKKELERIASRGGSGAK